MVCFMQQEVYSFESLSDRETCTTIRDGGIVIISKVPRWNVDPLDMFESKPSYWSLESLLFAVFSVWFKGLLTTLYSHFKDLTMKLGYTKYKCNFTVFMFFHEVTWLGWNGRQADYKIFIILQNVTHSSFTANFFLSFRFMFCKDVFHVDLLYSMKDYLGN